MIPEPKKADEIRKVVIPAINIGVDESGQVYIGGVYIKENKLVDCLRLMAYTSTEIIRIKAIQEDQKIKIVPNGFLDKIKSGVIKITS